MHANWFTRTASAQQEVRERTKKHERAKMFEADVFAFLMHDNILNPPRNFVIFAGFAACFETLHELEQTMRKAGETNHAKSNYDGESQRL